MTRPSPLMAALALLAALAFALSPLAVPGFKGFEPGQFPVPQIAAPIQPLGYAFSIWGVIYLWLVASALFGLAARARAVDWAPMRPALALSMGVGAAWLPVAKMSPVAATLLIWVMLAAALAALGRAPALDRWLARGPVGLYAGWLTAAACVALGLVLAGHGLLGQSAAALLCLLLALSIAAAVLRRIENAAEYGLAVAWALIAVALANWAAQTALAALAALGAALMLLAAWRSARH